MNWIKIECLGARDKRNPNGSPNGVLVVEQKSDGDVVDTGEFVIDDVFEHHGEVLVGLGEEGGVFRDVLADVPEDAGRAGLGGAGAEKLGAGEPDGGDAVVLLALAPRVEVEDHPRPRCPAPRGRCVRGGVRWRIDGVGEGVVDYSVGA